MALVDGEPITLYELKDFASGDPRLQRGAGATNKAEVLDLLITKQLIAKEVEKQGIVVQDADVDRYIARIRERNKIDEDQLEAALAQQGLSKRALPRSRCAKSCSAPSSSTARSAAR